MPRYQELNSINGCDLKVTKYSFGTAPLAGLFSKVPESESDATVQLAIDSGVNYFDSAPLYGHGVGERRLGRVLNKSDKKFVISTKVGRVVSKGENKDLVKWPDSDPNETIDYVWTRDGILKSLEDSFKRLGVDKVDIVYIHDADEHIREAIDVAYPVIHEFSSQGVIKAIGMGMNWCPPAVAIMKETEFNITLMAGRYTLLTQEAQKELFPLALKKGVSIVAAGVYNSGILANPVPGAHFDYAPASDEVLNRARAIQNFLKDFNVPLTAAALQFPLRHPAVATVLSGSAKVSELKQNLESFNFDLPADLWSQMESAGLIEPLN